METLVHLTEFTFSPQKSPLACFTDASSPRVVTALAGRVGSFPDLRAASYRQILKHASATRTLRHRLADQCSLYPGCFY